MSQTTQITPEQHKDQIEKYTAEKPEHYDLYAEVLKRVLERGCTVSFPEAVVQARAKAPSSFAEKCARRYDRYPDAVNQMTDLCGARVIVQTLEQVQSVRQFIEANFAIVEKDDKGLLLSEDKFGYRDLHYIVQLRSDRCEALGIAKDEFEKIGERRAEIQVRTWLQHAWADTLHDRIYKNALELSPAVHRTGALLAALMEEGDRVLNQLADELDGMISNYTAFAKKKEVEKEIEIQELILKNEPKESKKPGLALRLSRLYAACGQYERVVEELGKHHDIDDANRCQLLQDLGYALCKVSRRDATSSSVYQDGLKLLEESLELCSHPDNRFVLYQRKQESLRGRAHARLGWAWEALPGQEHKARRHKRQAHEHEPSSPYYLADMLGFEMKFSSSQTALPDAMRTIIRGAITTCRNHAVVRIELPHAFFTAGRLSLLLCDTSDSFDQYAADALGYYARGVRYFLEGTHCVDPDVIENEVSWIQRLHFGVEPPPAHQWVLELLAKARQLKSREPATSAPRVLVVVGGAVSIEKKTLERAKPLLQTALQAFKGDVISGGTMVGVPGCVGEIASALADQGSKNFQLVGYLPERRPDDAPKDDRYDRLELCGRDAFSPEQVLRSWSDVLTKGTRLQDIVVLGIGGGRLSAVEYRLALAFGATVVVVRGTGGAADDLLADELWSSSPNLLPIPCDAATVRAAVAPAERQFSDFEVKEMATAFHENYVSINTGGLPDNMKPWPDLSETYKDANRKQARYAVEILEACGFSVHEAEEPVILCFSEEDKKPDGIVDKMAELEHGRWNIDRLRGGWRYGQPRDNAKMLHDCLVSWARLPDDIKKYDREAVCKFPEILAKAKLQVYRP